MHRTHMDSLRAGGWCLFLMLTPLPSCSGVGFDEPVEAGAVDDSITGEVFAAAASLPLEHRGAVVFSGTIPEAGQLGVWNLGAVATGHRVIVDLDGHGRDFSIGLFDDNFQVLLINKDRYGSHDPLGVLDVAHGDLRTLYLVVTCEDPTAQEASYTVTVSHSETVVPPAQGPQRVVLNFSGGQNVTVGNVYHGVVWPFEAADLHPEWEGLNQDIREEVLQHLRRIYQGLDVEFIFGDALNRPEEASIIYFGGTHPSNVGLAASVDYGNRYRNQVAIVYTENFAKYAQYGYTPSEMAQGFANVAAHELGHLLGLNHSDLPADVMNVSPTVAALMAPQYFVESAALDPSVFPTGLQDGAERVFETVGGEWETVVQSRTRNALEYAAVLPPPETTRSGQAVAQLSTAVHCKTTHAE